MHTILLAAVLASGTPGIQPAKPRGDPGSWVTADDYPAESLKNNEMGYASFNLLVDPRGNAVQCSITVSSKSPVLDAETCRLITKRGKFNPAIDLNGTPIFGIFHSSVAWFSAEDSYSLNRLKSKYPSPPEYDIEVAVNKMPEGKRGPITIDLGLLVDGSGRSVACQPIETMRDTVLEKIACSQAMTLWTPIQMSDSKGSTTVQEVKVLFGVRK